ncbi:MULTISPECIES: hypothetical protein [unclassified Streptomyces]|uniref:hypothetical protein n=1 Tax=Streptomyces sp. NPDC055082 TaxID=3365718 RepID=UPI0037D17705
MNRVNLAFNDAELEVVEAAAGRAGMRTGSWAARQVMAVAQEVLVPVSADAGDVLRELIEARVRLRETTVLAGRLAPADPGVPELLAELRAAVARVDEATVRVMRERRSRA